MGLDVGDARIGVALSDPLGIIASPLKIITRDKSFAAVQAILDIVKENGVSRIIVGQPANMDGTLGSQAEKVREFVKELNRHSDIPTEFRDERLTTVQAKRILKNSRKTTRSTRYDAAAAALILQSYLDDSLPPKEYQEHESADTE
jgi:putative holliday junction resolvase